MNFYLPETHSYTAKKIVNIQPDAKIKLKHSEFTKYFRGFVWDSHSHDFGWPNLTAVIQLLLYVFPFFLFQSHQKFKVSRFAV